MDVDTSRPSPLHSLFLHWMSLPSTSLYIQHAIHSIRFPSFPNEAEFMKLEDPPPLPSANGTPTDTPAEDEDSSDDKPKFVINIPAGEETSGGEIVTASHPATASPVAGGTAHVSPVTSTAAVHTSHRLALRVDTDTRFACSSSSSSSPASSSPPLSPKSPAKQSPPASISPDPSQHSPHKKRKSNNANSPNAQSPANSPSSSPPHRLASTSPPKSPHASTPPRSPITRSPSSSALTLPPPQPVSSIRQFWWPEGQPASPATRRKDEKLARKLFRRAAKGGEEEEKEEEEEDEEEEKTDLPIPPISREALYPLTTQVCGLSSYCNGALYNALVAHSRQYFPHYHTGEEKEEQDRRDKAEEEEKQSSSQSEMDTKDNSASPPSSSTLIHLDVFLSYYYTNLQPFDLPLRFFRLLRPSPTARYLTRDSFKPIVAEIVSRHPGLEFLQSTPEFQFKYAQTVIARIFYQVNTSGSERLTVHELRQSNFLLMLGLLDQEDDINKLNDYFSYEHFYVIYCKFWELDSDHDGFIDVNDLASYDDYALTSKVIDRVISGCGRPLLSNVAVVTSYEMEAFFEEQKQRIQSLSQEQITFIDILCQLVDMIKGGQEAGKDLLPLSSTPVSSDSNSSQLASSARLHLSPIPPATFTKKDLRASHLASAFFNTLFNLNKFILSEQRDPVRIKQIHDTPQLSDWDRYAISGYYRLAEVDGEGGEEEVSEEDGWRGREGGVEAGEVYVREDVEEEEAEEEDGEGMEVDEQGGGEGAPTAHGGYGDAHMSDNGLEEVKQ